MYYNFNIFDQINPALVSKGNLYIKKTFKTSTVIPNI